MFPVKKKNKKKNRVTKNRDREGRGKIPEHLLHTINQIWRLFDFRIQIQFIISLLLFSLERLVSWLRNGNTLCQQLSYQAKEKRKKKKKISSVVTLMSKEKKLTLLSSFSSKQNKIFPPPFVNLKRGLVNTDTAFCSNKIQRSVNFFSFWSYLAVRLIKEQTWTPGWLSSSYPLFSSSLPSARRKPGR